MGVMGWDPMEDQIDRTPDSSIANGWGVLCQVLKRIIASVHRGFDDFQGLRGLDRFCGPARMARVGLVLGGGNCRSLHFAALRSR